MICDTKQQAFPCIAFSTNNNSESMWVLMTLWVEKYRGWDPNLTTAFLHLTPALQMAYPWIDSKKLTRWTLFDFVVHFHVSLEIPQTESYVCIFLKKHQPVCSSYPEEHSCLTLCLTVSAGCINTPWYVFYNLVWMDFWPMNQWAL